jgi:hypothetical protein
MTGACRLHYRVPLGPYPLMKRLVLLCVLLLPGIATAQAAVQGGYSTQPLSGPPLFDSARVTAESIALNNWLVSNYGSLSPERMAMPREHLYYLIDSRVKEIYANTGKVMPAGQDPVLSGLFSWAERLGVHGGALLYNRFRSSQFEDQSPQLSLPQGFSIELHGDLLRLDSASGGWSVDFPYYFMLWKVEELRAKTHQRMQIAVISTGAAKDKSKLGRSQATLMLIHAPGGKLNELLSFWEQRLEEKGFREQKDLGWNKLRSRYDYDAETKVHKELTGWSTPKGAFVVAYIGVDGTYQWNRPHFLDFMRAVRTNEIRN